jgi:bacterioferritin
MTKGTAPKAGAFLTDVKELRRRARVHMERGAVTDGYQSDRTTVLALLNTSLATELVCVLRYRRHHFMATGIHAQAVAAEFLEHATEEQGMRTASLIGSPSLAASRISTRRGWRRGATASMSKAAI